MKSTQDVPGRKTKKRKPFGTQFGASTEKRLGLDSGGASGSEFTLGKTKSLIGDTEGGFGDDAVPFDSSKVVTYMPEPNPNDRFKCHVDGQVMRALIIVTLENAVSMGLFMSPIHRGLGGLMSGIFGSKKEVGNSGSKQDNPLNTSAVHGD
jgi:hypothetical protein